ncbi:DUF5715 family protein [Odoribacter splanchnicus]|uniref:DUF5715 family protein n=1 Tax=Odoribacter splanchnicus TaxID=28118 RepID=UPI00210DC0B5|nr:DUF5715 family protein [Odoribacter splanchnicus]MCQ4903289.1 DUF5715 family protein [Odoribacter splanchnicus]
MQILKYIFIGLLIFLTCGCGGKKKQGEFRYFRNYQRTFNDLNDKHLKAAQQWGIQPVTSDELLEEQMGKLDKIGSCRYYQVDELTHSIPYLVPRAEKLLKTIGRNFQDSLSSKGLSSRKIIVTSVLRTTGNVKKLRKKNVNASANSAHVYGTTFDVAYARYKGAEKEETDKLKSVLAEVLQDLRKQKKCYVRYEFKQGCFHITVR